MAEKYSDFPAFLEAMRGKRLLHLGHKHADCDALGSAYAMSRVLPGAVGFARGMKLQTQALAEWLELEWIADPDPADYEYTIICDTLSEPLLGVSLPQRYAIFDHHESGGHRFSTIENQLAEAAEWGWVWPIESTCSLLVDLFQDYGVPIDAKMGVALAAGLMTDTVRLRQANAAALRRLAVCLEAAQMHIEDIWAVLESPTARAARRPAILASLRNFRQAEKNGWSMLVAEIDSQDNAFVLMDTMLQLGWDLGLVGFPKWGEAMVITICTAEMVVKTGVDLGGLMRSLAPEIEAAEAWGTPAGGRLIAPISLPDLMTRCEKITLDSFEI